MSRPLPPPRQVPVVPRPRHGELSASYLARVAHANRTEWRTFARLLGELPSDLPRSPSQLTFTIVTLNGAAFTRLLAYTGHQADRLIQAIPSLAPATFTRPGEAPALRIASLHDQILDCPQCRMRRDGAFIDTRLFPLKMACLRHGYWLYAYGAGHRLPRAVLPEITVAQNRLSRLAARRGTEAAVRAYRIAHRHLQHEWDTGVRASWYVGLCQRWHQRAAAIPSSHSTSRLPSWVLHPECTALAAIFSSPYWAELAIPSPDRRHRLFYHHLLLAIGDRHGDIRSIRNFDPLPEAIRKQASWARLLNDPEWGTPIPSRQDPRKIPFIDITDGNEALGQARPSHDSCDHDGTVLN